MLVSLRWLNQISPLGADPDQILETLTMAGLEVEHTLDLGMKSGKIVVAKVLEVAPHPDADKLRLVKADVGKEHPASIVCGAPNVREGMLVPCALPGAELPGGVNIRKSKIRGVVSEGMLCSAKELNFGSDHDGILELSDQLTPGEPFDFIVDVKVTPNRADCLSMVGIARDLAAMLGRKRTYPTTFRFTETLGQKVEEFIHLDIEERGACLRYTCRYLKNVKIGPSPLWLVRTLEACGLRSINNIVDITNYVMLEYGVPLHAFDYAAIAGAKIVVRFAKQGETIVTLDDKTVELHPEDLVIADAERPIALAGVMGGRNTQVTSGTTNIILECACFDPITIRKTARRHGLQTDAAYRFERGVDRGRLQVSLARATQLMADLAHASVVRGFHDVQAPAPEEPPISLNLNHLNHLLGLRLSNTETADHLTNLGFEIRRSDRESLLVAPPSYRMDVRSEVDLIEEVARLHGYNKIPETMPGIVVRRAESREFLERPLRTLRSLLSGFGFSEAVHYSFVAREDAERHGFDPSLQIQLANPLTANQSILRPLILSGLLATAGFNQRQGSLRVALYEIGKVFPPSSRPSFEEDEGLSLALVLTGDEPVHWSRGGGSLRQCDFYDMKGSIEALAASWGLNAKDFNFAIQELTPAADEGSDPGFTSPRNIWHPGRSAKIVAGEETLGFFGEIHPHLALGYDMKGRVYAAELDLAKILRLMEARKSTFSAIPKFPSSERDLALIVDAGLPVGKLIETAGRLARPLAEEIAVVDLYTGRPIPEGKKSVALSFRLRSLERTLTDEEISATMSKIQKGLEEQCGAALRA